MAQPLSPPAARSLCDQLQHAEELQTRLAFLSFVVANGRPRPRSTTACSLRIDTHAVILLTIPAIREVRAPSCAEPNLVERLNRTAGGRYCSALAIRPNCVGYARARLGSDSLTTSRSSRSGGSLRVPPSLELILRPRLTFRNRGRVRLSSLVLTLRARTCPWLEDLCR